MSACITACGVCTCWARVAVMCSHPSSRGQRPSESFWGRAQLAFPWHELCVRSRAFFSGGENWAEREREEEGEEGGLGTARGPKFTERLIVHTGLGRLSGEDSSVSFLQEAACPSTWASPPQPPSPTLAFLGPNTALSSAQGQHLLPEPFPAASDGPSGCTHLSDAQKQDNTLHC